MDIQTKQKATHTLVLKPKTSWNEKLRAVINGITATNPSNNMAGSIKNHALLFIDFSMTNRSLCLSY
jgi:hypothetical protein